MEKRNWLKYLGFIVLLLALIFLDRYINFKFDHLLTADNYASRFILYKRLTCSMIINMAVGVFLGLKSFLSKLREPGRWKFNWLRALILLLPLLYVILSPYFIFYYKISYYIFRPLIVTSSWTFSQELFIPAQILFGFFLITSFYKVSTEEICESNHDDNSDDITLSEK